MIVTNPFSDLRSWTRAQVEAVSRGWWTLLVMAADHGGDGARRLEKTSA